ncbi:hypothetical protein J8273_5388 [Carpediemonas membranifera]|uniref:Uncharacterized protein n=1 Tax=Carpediemonas membranifera TaxID=201153 RepID=A0A8J6ARU1_9EUKA|nr:hypothetical protein J8273_5388 [Carpediemonas membranifera]|eukprot:KAG9392398.1 hypothetical protein J8273_5388 [Carpediemonas membranifera]
MEQSSAHTDVIVRPPSQYYLPEDTISSIRAEQIAKSVIADILDSILSSLSSEAPKSIQHQQHVDTDDCDPPLADLLDPISQMIGEQPRFTPDSPPEEQIVVREAVPHTEPTAPIPEEPLTRMAADEVVIPLSDAARALDVYPSIRMKQKYAVLLRAKKTVTLPESVARAQIRSRATRTGPELTSFTIDDPPFEGDGEPVKRQAEWRSRATGLSYSNWRVKRVPEESD